MLQYIVEILHIGKSITAFKETYLNKGLFILLWNLNEKIFLDLRNLFFLKRTVEQKCNVYSYIHLSAFLFCFWY